MSHTCKIISIREVTHDVRKIRIEKPDDYQFTPGQATEVSINKDGWEDEKRPFTFTSLQSEDHLEFVIKVYEDHDGVTEQIGKLQEGDELIIDDAWGTIEYKGPGVFLAGGAGVTPFIAILRDLNQKDELDGNRLIFSNKTAKDVILEEEFREMLGDQFQSVLTDEEAEGHESPGGFIDKAYLKEQINDFSQPFYVCGPPAFNDNMIEALKELGADPDGLVFEE